MNKFIITMDPISRLYMYIEGFEDVREQILPYLGIDYDYIGNVNTLYDIIFPTIISVEVLIKLSGCIKYLFKERHDQTIFNNVHDLNPPLCEPFYAPPQRRMNESLTEWRLRRSLMKADNYIRGNICQYFHLINNPNYALSDIVFPVSIDDSRLVELHNYMQTYYNDNIIRSRCAQLLAVRSAEVDEPPNGIDIITQGIGNLTFT